MNGAKVGASYKRVQNAAIVRVTNGTCYCCGMQINVEKTSLILGPKTIRKQENGKPTVVLIEKQSKFGPYETEDAFSYLPSAFSRGSDAWGPSTASVCMFDLTWLLDKNRGRATLVSSNSMIKDTRKTQGSFVVRGGRRTDDGGC